MMRTSFSSLLVLTALALLNLVSALDFAWPSSTVQCEVVSLKLTGGSPPYSVHIIPIEGSFTGWNLNPPDSGQWLNETWNIAIQFPAGTAYVVYMSHSGIFGAGGVTPIQIVGNSVSSGCLTTASRNQTLAHMNMKLYGSLSECDDSLLLTHDGSSAGAPYNYTIIPLDGGYKPWSTAINSNSVPINVNMTSGSRFTVMMNDRFGYGGAQIGSIYRVTNTSSSIGCQQQLYVQPSGFTWPVSLRATPLPSSDQAVSLSATASVSPSAGPTSLNNGDAGSGSGLSTGAIAGIGAGVGVLAIAGIVVLVWYCLRRKKREGRSQGYGSGSGGGGMGGRGKKGEPKFDMFQSSSAANGAAAGMGDAEKAPKVEPFRSHSDYVRSSVPVQSYEGVNLGGGGEGGGGVNQYGSTMGATSPHLSPSESGSRLSAPSFPVPQPTGAGAGMGGPAPALSESEFTSVSGSGYYNVAAHTGLLSPHSTGIDSTGDLHAHAHPHGSGSGSGSPPPPSPMVRGPVSAAAEKARLSRQYASLEVGGSGTQGSTSPGPMSGADASPMTPLGPYHQQQQQQQAQGHAQSPPQSPEPEPASAVSNANADSAQRASATYRRHQDGGVVESENILDVGTVDLPPLYEDVPGRRQ